MTLYQHRNDYVVSCNGCGHRETLLTNNYETAIKDVRALQDAGWSVSYDRQRGSRHLCTECSTVALKEQADPIPPYKHDADKTWLICQTCGAADPHEGHIDPGDLAWRLVVEKENRGWEYSFSYDQLSDNFILNHVECDTCQLQRAYDGEVTHELG